MIARLSRFASDNPRRLAVLMCLAVAVIGTILMVVSAIADWQELMHPDAFAFPPDPNHPDNPHVSVITTIKDFDPLAGSSRNGVQVMLEYYGAACPQNKLALPENRKTIEFNGPLKLKADSAYSNFFTSGQAQVVTLDMKIDRPIIWYPFDRYTINLPTAIVPSFVPSSNYAPPGCAVSAPHPQAIVSLQIESRLSAVLARGINGGIVLERPRLLRLITILLALVTFIFLVFLAFQRDVTALMWQSLGFFATVWAARNILLTNVTVFPVVVDYVSIYVYFLAALILIAKWLLAVRATR